MRNSCSRTSSLFFDYISYIFTGKQYKKTFRKLRIKTGFDFCAKSWVSTHFYHSIKIEHFGNMTNIFRIENYHKYSN